jgi:hypothetical protein
MARAEMYAAAKLKSVLRFSAAQGIGAEIPQAPRRGAEELERIARFPAAPEMRPNYPKIHGTQNQ